MFQSVQQGLDTLLNKNVPFIMFIVTSSHVLCMCVHAI